MTIRTTELMNRNRNGVTQLPATHPLKTNMGSSRPCGMKAGTGSKELGCLGGFFVVDVADALEEQERKDECLPIRTVDGAAAQYVGAVPEM